MGRSPPRPRGFMVHVILTSCLFLLAAYQTFQMQSERQTLQLRDQAIATQDGVISEAKEKIQMLTEQMKDRGASLNEVGKQRDLLVEELAAVQKQLQEAISSNAELEDAKSELQDAKSSFEDQVRDKEAEIEGLKETLKLERAASQKGLSECESLEKIRVELQEENTRILAEVEKLKREGTALASAPPAPAPELAPTNTPPLDTESVMPKAKPELRGSEDNPMRVPGTMDDSGEARSVAEVMEKAEVKKEGGEEETLLAKKEEDEKEGFEGGGEGDEEEDEEEEKDEGYKGDQEEGKSGESSKLNGRSGDPEDRDEEGEAAGKEDEMEEEVAEATAKEEEERLLKLKRESVVLKDVGGGDEVEPRGTPGLETLANGHVYNENAAREGEFVNTKEMDDAWEAERRERKRARKEERQRVASLRASKMTRGGGFVGTKAAFTRG